MRRRADSMFAMLAKLPNLTYNLGVLVKTNEYQLLEVPITSGLFVTSGFGSPRRSLRQA